jgi:hypothetical protein
VQVNNAFYAVCGVHHDERCDLAIFEDGERFRGEFERGDGLGVRIHGFAGRLAERRAALEKLRIQLTSPQPEAKKIRRRVLRECDWKLGELIAYKLLSGELIVFRMIGLHSDKGGKSPYVELLDWRGEAPPSLDMLRSTPIRTGRTSFGRAVTRLLMLGTRARFKNRLDRLEMTLQPEQTKLAPAPALLWKQLDARLAEWFDLG